MQINQLTFDRNGLLEFLPQHGICAELGVDKGDYSKQILEKNKPNKLFLIDSWENMLTSHSNDVAHSEKFYSVKKMFEGNVNVSIIKKNTNQSCQDFKDEYFDWIYIDADHHFEPCLSDLNRWSKKVKSNGYICGHDYLTKPKKGFGVNQAVDKFLQDTGYEFIGITNESNFKSFVIQKT